MKKLPDLVSEEEKNAVDIFRHRTSQCSLCVCLPQTHSQTTRQVKQSKPPPRCTSSLEKPIACIYLVFFILCVFFSRWGVWSRGSSSVCVQCDCRMCQGRLHWMSYMLTFPCYLAPCGRCTVHDPGSLFLIKS